MTAVRLKPDDHVRYKGAFGVAIRSIGDEGVVVEAHGTYVTVRWPSGETRRHWREAVRKLPRKMSR